jgi:hypothetical protein
MISLGGAKAEFGDLKITKAKLETMYNKLSADEQAEVEGLVKFFQDEMNFSLPAAKYLGLKYLESIAEPEGGMSLTDMVSRAHALYKRTQPHLRRTYDSGKALITSTRDAAKTILPQIKDLTANLRKLYDAARNEEDALVETVEAPPEALGKKRRTGGSVLFG